KTSFTIGSSDVKICAHFREKGKEPEPKPEPKPEEAPKKLSLRELAIIAMREGRGGIWDELKAVKAGRNKKKYVLSADDSGSMTVAKGCKFYVGNRKGKVRSENRAALKPGKRGQVKARKTVSECHISFDHATRNKEIAVSVNVIDPEIMGGSGLEATVKRGDTFDFPTTIPLNAGFGFADSNGKVYDFIYKGEDSIGEDGRIHIRGRAYEKGTVTIPFKVYGKKFRAKTLEKQVVFYSPSYAAKQREERARVIEKAKDLIKNPSKYTKATGYGAAKYIDDIVFDRESGEIVIKKGKALSLNEELIRDEAKFDGYYAIVTNEEEKTDKEILDIYRGLWKIEETFKITKSGLSTRPIYLKTIGHVKAHFLICFTALLIMRLLEYRLKRKHSVQTIIESLRRCECSLLESNMYVFDYYDEVLQSVGTELGIDFSRKYRSLKEIKNELGDTKKPAPLK
ncbi:MAG: transposase, partial [Lachnospiraceae bacterium]|nr:transposase [Lachnospiraceae bacterium]